MSWRIPTIPEIGSYAWCILWGHEWDGDRCENCGVDR